MTYITQKDDISQIGHPEPARLYTIDIVTCSFSLNSTPMIDLHYITPSPACYQGYKCRDVL